MVASKATSAGFSFKAYAGDSKTLLAFNFTTQAAAKNLAGFSIFAQPSGQPGYYLFNELAFATPADHAQLPLPEPPNSTANAPIQKYRWTHVTGSMHQGLAPVTGDYTYTVTPRFFSAAGTMLPLDSSLSATLTIPVGPFVSGALALGFTRGYMQSEAFAHHFGVATKIVPANRSLQFDTSAQAGTNPQGQPVTYAQIYNWMGSSARQQIFAVLNQVLNDPNLTLDFFAYDLDEPDVITIFLKLAAQGRMRLILDNASLHVTTTDPKTGKITTPLEVPFLTAFQQQLKAPSAVVQGCFDRFSHDKILIVSENGKALKVLTGATNFSVNGLYVNANHVLVFTDSVVAEHYAAVFAESWTILSAQKTPSASASNAFAATPLSATPFTSADGASPNLSITFAPHTTAQAATILNAISARITQEAAATAGSVFFAVMQINNSDTPVYNTLNAIHATKTLVSEGISDGPSGTAFYSPGTSTGVLVTGKPGITTLPPPFDQVAIPPGHEIHDKFVVCGLNGPDPVVWCGSSNLAGGGENQNGDNLLEIHDAAVAAAFTIEALLLVDHYAFLDKYANPKKPNPQKPNPSPAPVGTATSTSASMATRPPAAVKKAATRRSPAKPSPATAPTPVKAPAKPTSLAKPPARKTVATKSPASKTPLKKSTAAKPGKPAPQLTSGKAPAKKLLASKTTSKNAPGQKVVASKTPARKSPVKKVVASNVTAQKVPAKQAVAKKLAGKTTLKRS